MFPSLDQCSEEEKVQRLLDLKLRYFTPREVANLMGFPQSFSKRSLVSQSLAGLGLDRALIHPDRAAEPGTHWCLVLVLILELWESGLSGGHLLILTHVENQSKASMRSNVHPERGFWDWTFYPGLNSVSVYFAAFPESVSTKQQYRLLGNSLNVVVVAKLLQLLVSPELQHKDGGHR